VWVGVSLGKQAISFVVGTLMRVGKNKDHLRRRAMIFLPVLTSSLVDMHLF
jgi:hypothetical protein